MKRKNLTLGNPSHNQCGQARKKWILAGIVMAAGCLTPQAWAYDYTWNKTDTTANWANVNNWTPSAPTGGPNGVDVSLLISFAATADRTINLNTATTTTVGSIDIGNTTSAFTVTLGKLLSGSALKFQVSSGNAQLNMLSGSLGAVNLDSPLPITLGSNLDVSNGSSKALTLSGTLDGTGNLIFYSNGAGTITASNTINNVGKITNSGSGSGTTTISGSMGTNVTGVTQNSATSKLVLSNTNTYTGATVVNAGTLLVNGSIASSSLTTVKSGGTVTGTGTVGALKAESGSTLAPGNGGVGTLNASSLTWDGGATFTWDLSNSDNTSDVLALSGGLSKGTSGTYLFDFQNSGFYNGSTPTVYTLMTFSSISGLSLGTDFSYQNLGAGLTGDFVLNSNSLQFSVTATTIPEPETSTLIIGGAGLMFVLVTVKRRRRHSGQ